MFSEIKHKFKKLGFISIELVILASVMLTAGGYGVAKLGGNATGATKNEDGLFNESIKKLKGDDENTGEIPEYVEKIKGVQTLYGVGEDNLTDADIVDINGVPCYVLERVDGGNMAKMITVDIYDVRFDDANYNTGNKTNVGTGDYANLTYDYSQSELQNYMVWFFKNKLGSDERIQSQTVTYYTKSGYYSSDLSTYTKGSLDNQKVYALDAVEAKENASKFKWNYSTKKMKNREGAQEVSRSNFGFWTTAGCRGNGRSNVFRVSADRYFGNVNVDNSGHGARPAFLIDLN